MHIGLESRLLLAGFVHSPSTMATELRGRLPFQRPLHQIIAATTTWFVHDSCHVGCVCSSGVRLPCVHVARLQFLAFSQKKKKKATYDQFAVLRRRTDVILVVCLQEMPIIAYGEAGEGQT